jgi:hypothetical protein
MKARATPSKVRPSAVIPHRIKLRPIGWRILATLGRKLSDKDGGFGDESVMLNRAIDNRQPPTMASAAAYS